MAIFRVPAHAGDAFRRTRRRVAQVVAAMVVLVALPLAVTSLRVTRTEQRLADIRSVTTTWADEAGWEVLQVTDRGDDVLVRVSGPDPAPDLDGLRADLDDAGLESVEIEVELVTSTGEDI